MAAASSVRRQPLATGDDEVAGARRRGAARMAMAARISSNSPTDASMAASAAAPRRARRQHRRRHPPVALAQGRDRAGGGLGPARHRVIGGVEQHVGDAGQRRGHDDQRPAIGGDAPRRGGDGGGVGERGAAELPDVQGSGPRSGPRGTGARGRGHRVPHPTVAPSPDPIRPGLAGAGPGGIDGRSHRCYVYTLVVRIRAVGWDPALGCVHVVSDAVPWPPRS